MSNKDKQRGRLVALQLLDKMKPKAVEPEKPQEPVTLDLDPLVEAIGTLANNHVDLTPLVEALAEHKPESLDLSPLIEVIASIELDARIDLEPVTKQIELLAKKPSTNFAPVVDKLEEIKKAMEENTKVLSDLVAVVKMPKNVKYDTMGRIIEIGVK